MAWDPNVRTGRAAELAGFGTASGMTDDPIATAAALVARLTTVFDTVIAEPGTRVWDPRT